MLRKNRKFKVGGSGGLPTLGARRLLKAGYLVPGVAVGLLGFLSITALNPMADLSVYAEDDPGVVTLSAFLSPSITLSMSSSVSESIEPTVDGAFKNLATAARVQVMNSEYYDISISGNPDMVGTTNPDAKIAAISGEKKASEFVANTWGYNASKNNAGVTAAVVATSDTTYEPVPSTSTAIVSRQATTNNAADDCYSLNFGAKVDTSIPADTYTSRVTLSVVASPVQATEYSLTYDGNGNDGGTVPTAQSASDANTTYEFTVAEGTPTRSGYTFLGWADGNSATVAQYTAGDKITVSEDNPDKTIYAVWGTSIFGGIAQMQQMTNAICKAAKEGDTAQLIDTRANADTTSLNKYWITKLRDGNCWMTQNLDYAPSTPLSTSSVDSEEKDTGKIWDDGLKVISVAGYSGSAVSVSGKSASSDKNFIGPTSEGEYNAHYLTGNYYQYSAAQTACPSGWSMPTTNQTVTVNGSLNKLLDGFSSAQINAAPYYFMPAGDARPNRGRMDAVGGYGYVWSSTPHANNTAFAYSMSINGFGPNLSDSNSRYNGRSVRCYVNGN